MPNLEESIRERAYQLWVADGEPEGQDSIHWLRAQREVLASGVARAATALEPEAMTPRPGKKRHDRGYAWRIAV
jgi:Protein of unknown function (DUF2934)